MSLPVTFATLAGGNQPLALLDQQFAAVGDLVVIPSTAVGQNAVVLTPVVNTPTVTAYTSLAPIFSFIATQTSSGAVTVKVGALAALPLFKNNGTAPVSGGDLVAGQSYYVSYSPTAQPGIPGFVLINNLPVTGAGISGVVSINTAYTVNNGDKNKNLAFGGNAFYTVTVNAVGGYDADFQITIHNADPGRGKTIAVNGYAAFTLWPKQRISVIREGGVWAVTPESTRWVTTAGSAQFYVDPALGSDSNDGLGGGSGAFASLQKAVNVLRTQVDCYGFAPDITVAAAAALDVGAGVLVNYALVGASLFSITLGDGSTTTCSVANGSIINARDGGATVTLKSSGGTCTLLSTVAGCTMLNASQLAVIDTGGNGIIFGNCSTGVHMMVTGPGAAIGVGGSYSVSGAATSHIFVVGSGARINYGSFTATIIGAPVIGTWANLDILAELNANGVAMSFAGAPAAGCKKYTLDRNAIAASGPSGTPAVFPGSVAGTQANGAQFW